MTLVKVTRNVAQYPLHHVTYSATKFEVAPSNYIDKKIHYLTFDLGVKVTRNVVQYLLHHVTYLATKFEVATSKIIYIKRDGPTHGRTDFGTKLIYPFFLK